MVFFLSLYWFESKFKQTHTHSLTNWIFFTVGHITIDTSNCYNIWDHAVHIAFTMKFFFPTVETNFIPVFCVNWTKNYSLLRNIKMNAYMVHAPIQCWNNTLLNKSAKGEDKACKNKRLWLPISGSIFSHTLQKKTRRKGKKLEKKI